jgi:hypothetical protein
MIDMSPLRLLSIALLGTVLPLAAHSTELVTNGGFELPAVPAGAPYLIAVTPTGWTGLGDIAVQGYAGSVPSGQGSQWFDLNPSTDAGTGLSQTLTFAAGTPYHFSFVYNGGGGGTTTQIAFSIASLAETLLSGFVSTAALDAYSGSPWAVFSTTFTPTTGGAETLTFTPNGAWSGGFIDAVSVTTEGSTSAIPEPSIVWLMVAGLAAFGARSKERAKRSGA